MAFLSTRRARLVVLTLPFLLPALGSAQTPSHDAAGYYIRLDAGYGVARDAKATGVPVTGRLDEAGQSPIVAAGVGYRFNRHFRMDLTTGYAGSYELDDRDGAGNGWKADIDAWSTFVNLYAEYPVGEWSPYLTAGAGMSRNRTGTLTRSPTPLTIPGKTTTEFAWQAGAGVGYSLSPNWSLDLGYRYVDAGEFRSGETASDGSTGNTVRGDLRSHVALLGIRPQENLFLEADGTWTHGAPIPAYVRRYPFILMETPDRDRMVLCVEEDASVIGPDGEFPLFDGDKAAEAGNDALNFCGVFNQSAAATGAFCDALKAQGLLVEQRADLVLPDKRRISLSGFCVVDEKKFHELPDDVWLDWRRKNWIGLVYTHLLSLGRWGMLTDLASRRDAAKGQAA